MVTDKQRENLAKGRQKGIKRKSTTTARGTSWADLIREIGEQPSKVDPTKTNKQLVVEQAYTHAALGNAAILRELMQRSEPQDTTVNVKGEIALFNYATIDRLIAGRSTGDTSEPITD